MKCTLLVTKTFRKPSETSRGGYAKVVYLEPCQTSMVVLNTSLVNLTH